MGDSDSKFTISDLWKGTFASFPPKTADPPPQPTDAILKAAHPYPRKLFVETTTRCNLHCSMCMKQTDDSAIVEGDLSLETFRSVEPLLPMAHSLVLSGIGEPLLHPQLEDFVRIARSLMPAEAWIGFQSNGLLLTEPRAAALIEGGLDRLCISLDSVSPQTFSRMRAGSELTDIESAFAVLAAAKKICSRPDFRVGMEFVLLRENLRELPQALRWAASRGIDFAIVSHLLPYDPGFVGKVAYDSNTPKATALLKDWRLRGEAEGIDISSYFKVAFEKREKTDEEKRMIAFVRAMMADARRRDIFLNVEFLLQRDPSLLSEVKHTLAAASDVAQEVGIDIRLPAAAPKDDRECDFINDGSLFLSWDGKVHPCYFLWHTYACYFAKRKKYVHARSFGDISEKAALKIWNSAVFRSFREDVARGDYPFCTNCNLLPCEYLYNEHFEQDCYTNTIPCGDCFWCMGLFNCMS